MISTYFSSFIMVSKILAAPLLRDQAYLDPGSGSFILQILLAALLGSLFLVKSYWQKIKTFFKNRFSKPQDDQKE